MLTFSLAIIGSGNALVPEDPGPGLRSPVRCPVPGSATAAVTGTM
jgi:hypothetical protein